MRRSESMGIINQTVPHNPSQPLFSFPHISTKMPYFWLQTGPPSLLKGDKKPQMISRALQYWPSSPIRGHFLGMGTASENQLDCKSSTRISGWLMESDILLTWFCISENFKQPKKPFKWLERLTRTFNGSVTWRNCWLSSDPLLYNHLTQLDTTVHICPFIVHFIKGRREEQGKRVSSQNNNP